MKKIFVILAAIICSPALLLSCEENITIPPDDTEKGGNRFEQRLEIAYGGYIQYNSIYAYYDGENVKSVKYRIFSAPFSEDISDEDIVKELEYELTGEDLAPVNNPDTVCRILFDDLIPDETYEVAALATFEDNTTRLCRNSISTGDDSPAALISLIGLGYGIVEATASYDGAISEKVNDNYANSISIAKVSDNEISLHCHTYWNNEESLDISIPVISIAGEPIHVTFDCSCDGAEVTYKGVKYTDVNSTITGYIKIRQQSKSSGNEIKPFFSPGTPDFDCEIHMVFDDIDGKVLDLTILAIAPY